MGNILRNGLSRVHENVFTLLLARRHYLYIRNLYDPVVNKIKPRCLKVKDNKGLGDIQFHYKILIVQKHRHDEHQHLGIVRLHRGLYNAGTAGVGKGYGHLVAVHV